MKYYYFDREVDELKAYGEMDEFYDKNRFQDILDDEQPLVQIMGESYYAGRALRELDPLRFEVFRDEHVQACWHLFKEEGFTEVPYLSCEPEEDD